MLNKNIDFAIVGHNFFSYLMGIGLQFKNKKVLILDDNRFNHGNLFTDSLTIFDLEILKKWGEKFDVPPLKKMEEYIQFSPMSFMVGRTEIILGDNPSKNYTELARKFPQFFKINNMSVVFDQGVFQIASSLADAFFTDKNLLKLSKRMEVFKQLEVMKKFDEFYALFFQKEKWEMQSQCNFNSLVFLCRGFFHNRLSTNGTRSELMHLFFSIISPHFKFDHERLVADLLAHYQNIGGEFKKLNLSDIKFQRGVLSSFELESFEGIICPSHLIFIGGEPVEMPIMLKEKVAAFNSLEVKIQLESEVPKILEGKKILFSSPLKIGTNLPQWEANFNGNSIVFNLVIIKRQGIKEEFVVNKVISSLQSDLEFLFPEYVFKIQSSDCKFTLDVLLEDCNPKAYLSESPPVKLQKTTVYSKISPYSFLKLKNVSYIGPYIGNTHGVFSSLIHLQKSMESF